jgi:RTX calcium-binding nonapeptide repeat (4 copies)
MSARNATRRLIALPLALLALLIPVGAAQADLSLTGPVAAPADTHAGHHSNFTLSFNVSGGDHIQNLTTELPPGLVGNPQAANFCFLNQLMADQCPASSRIGSATSGVTATLPPDPPGVLTAPLTVAGDVYNVIPLGSDPATLGIVLRANTLPPEIVDTAPTILIGHASARPTDFGLNTTITNIPRQANVTLAGNVPATLNVRIDSTSLTLNGTNPQFMTNPTSCGTKTTRITATSYEGNSATATPSFESTNCADQVYAPHLAVTLDMSKDAAHIGHPDVTTEVTQSVDQANSRRVEAILPKTLQANNAALINQCPLASFQASSCPANTQLGNAVARTPLLSVPLGGPVYLVQHPGFLPQVGLDLKGPLPAKILGNAGLTSDFRLDNVFGEVAPGLPDVPLTQFRLTFNGGDDGLITATHAVCKGGDNTFNAVFDSYGGQHLTESGTPTIKGCEFAKRLAKNRCHHKKLTDVGSKHRDTIRGTKKRDVINGLGGSDTIIGLKGNDLLCGGKGKDKIKGGPGKDQLFGGAGKDTLIGGGGKDQLFGGAGKDRQKQ